MLRGSRFFTRHVHSNTAGEARPHQPQMIMMRCNKSCLRIVLLGKTGVGKSAAGNTILNEKVFKSTRKSSSITFKCEKKTADVNDQMVSVVDTPGLFDTKQPHEEVMREIAKCISYLSPGPHAFIVVIRADTRFTKEEQKTVKLIQKMFGEKASRYTMALFTRGDDLEADGESIEDFMEGDEHLVPFISQCRGGYHVFNNRSEDPSQVRQLLKKIKIMVQVNGGGHYTTEMFDAVEKTIEKKKKKIKEDDPNISEDDARGMAEDDNDFNNNFPLYLGAAGAAAGGVGAGIGVFAAGAGVAATGAAVAAGAAVAFPIAALVGVALVANQNCCIQ